MFSATVVQCNDLETVCILNPLVFLKEDISGVGRMRVNYALFISALKNTLIAYMIKEVLNQPINFVIFFLFYMSVYVDLFMSK